MMTENTEEQGGECVCVCALSAPMSRLLRLVLPECATLLGETGLQRAPGPGISLHLLAGTMLSGGSSRGVWGSVWG